MNKIKRLSLLCCFIFLSVVIYRFLSLFFGLEYDEIWTLMTYASSDLTRIFMDLETPNNHPLNSLLISGLQPYLPVHLAVRLPAYLAGLAVIPLTMILAWKLFRSRAIVYGAGLFIALIPSFFSLGTIGRGYVLQVVLILFYALSVWEWAEGRKKIWLFFELISGILSVLTLPTSVLWLFPISMVHCVYEWKRRKDSLQTLFPQMLTYSILSIILLCWFLFHFHAFRAGQQFGIAVTSFSQFFSESSIRIFSLCGIGMGILTMLAFLLIFQSPHRRFRELIPILYLLILFPFFMAIFTKMGPARVYAPSVPFAAILAALTLRMILCKLRFTRIAVRQTVLILAVLFLSCWDFFHPAQDWVKSDWTEHFSSYRKLPENVFVNLSPTETLPALFNNGQAILDDYKKRMDHLGQDPDSYFLQLFAKDSMISGSDAHFSGKTCNAGIQSGQNSLGVWYRLRPYIPGEKGTVFFLKTMLSGAAALQSELEKHPDTEVVLRANTFFSIKQFSGNTSILLIWKLKTAKVPETLPAIPVFVPESCKPPVSSNR